MQRDLLPVRLTDGSGVSAGGATRQLAHLESILHELTRQEARSATESVERKSVVTQQRLLKNQLLKGARARASSARWG